MEIYLLRHGTAEDARPGHRDRDRELTDKGRDEVKRVLKRARSAGVQISAILSSPYLRAVQTAEIAAKLLRFEGPIVQTKNLLPDATPRQVWDELRSRAGEPAVLLAGHQPLLGDVVSYLLGSTSSLVNMKKAALVRIDVDGFGGEPAGILAWMLIPALARDD